MLRFQIFPSKLNSYFLSFSLTFISQEHMKHFLSLIFCMMIVCDALGSIGGIADNGSTDRTIISNPFYSKSAEKSCITFEVKVESPDVYYVSFWLLPIKINKLDYPVYDIFIDSNKLDQIKPTQGGWQVISGKNKKKAYLSEGTHYISVTVPHPIPLNVEKLYLSQNVIGKNEDSEKYEAYLESCKDESVIDFVQEAKDTRDLSFLGNGEVLDMPLLYTFHNYLPLKEGDILKIRSVGRLAHCLDLVFYGSPKFTGVIPPIRPVNDSNLTASDDPVINTGLVPATTEEMSGLTWTAGSRLNKGFGVNLYGEYETEQKIKIPKTGTYYLRARALDNGKSGTAMIEYTTGEFEGEWEEIPISNSYKLVYFPPNHIYQCNTYCADLNNIEHVMTLQLYVGDRIQDYKFSTPGNSDKDISLSNRLKYPTGVISINGTSSSTPESKCDLFYNCSPYSKELYNLIKARKIAEVDKISFQNQGLRAIITESDLIVNSEEAGLLEIYDINGIFLASRQITNPSKDMTFSLTDLNIPEKGIFILKLSYEKGMHSLKLVR